jgi:hypothetical protein
MKNYKKNKKKDDDDDDDDDDDNIQGETSVNLYSI